MKANLKERFIQIKIIILEKVRDPQLRKKVLSRNFLVPLVAGLILFFFIFSFTKDHVSCVGGFPVYKKSKKEPEKKDAEPIPMPVKVYKVARVSFRDTLPALGTIRGFREFDLKFPVSGVVEYINFKEGEQITQGDIIASLDQKESLLKLEYAKIEMEKQAKLYEIGSIIEAKLRQAQLEYQSAKTELDKTNLIAISDGYIGSLDVDRGAFVSPQDKVGAFVDLKDVYIEFGIIEKDVAKVREGQNIEMTVDSYPDQVFKGEVDSISPIVEGKSRTVRVRSKIANVDEKIKPGMFGRVNVLVYEKDEALVIPSSSFKKKDDQYFVYIVHSEEQPEEGESDAPMPKASLQKPGALPQEPEPVYGTLEARTIEVQYATPDAIEVKEGLDEGDLVVVDVEQDLEDKARVEITETQEGIF